MYNAWSATSARVPIAITLITKPKPVSAFFAYQKPRVRPQRAVKPPYVRVCRRASARLRTYVFAAGLALATRGCTHRRRLARAGSRVWSCLPCNVASETYWRSKAPLVRSLSPFENYCIFRSIMSRRIRRGSISSCSHPKSRVPENIRLVIESLS